MHKQWDKFETLAATAPVSVCIFATPQGTDFVLVGLDAAGDAGVMCDVNARGLGFAGVIGLMADGSPRAAFVQPFDDGVVDKISSLFVGYFVRRFLDAQPPAPAPTAPDVQNDSEAWLWRLWAFAAQRNVSRDSRHHRAASLTTRQVYSRYS